MIYLLHMEYAYVHSITLVGDDLTNSQTEDYQKSSKLGTHSYPTVLVFITKIRLGIASEELKFTAYIKKK